MKIFIIHRFVEIKSARTFLKKVAQDLSIEVSFIFMKSGDDLLWKQKAINSIEKSEAVIVFNPEACNESDNAKWEIEKAIEAEKEIINIYPNAENENAFSMLISIYRMEQEFDNCFSKKDPDVFELYKIMVESSENLIERRQKTNAFFITALGSILAIAGLLVKPGEINNNSIIVLYGFALVSLLLCKSWWNLIDNYGKLNTAKYKVILRLEKELDAQSFSAEWVALGKGLRPKKYKSFTNTEKNVPLYFSILIIILIIISVIWPILVER